MKRLALVVACVAACHAGASLGPPVVALPPVASAAASVASTPPAPRATAVGVVVTGAPYAGLALWRASATGHVEPMAFPWAKLTISDSLCVSPDGLDVAYVEGGTAFGPLLVRALSDGAMTLVAPHVAGGELLVVAWSPDGRKVLYAKRRAGQVRPACDFTGCPSAGPSSFFVFDRERRVSVKTEVPDELAAWLPSGDLVVADDDAALIRVHGGTKTPVAAGPYRHGDFALDVAGDRLLSTGWNDATKRNEVLALDLHTWQETPIAPPAPYATYLWPHASPSGKRVAWLATSVTRRPFTEALVVDGKTLVAPARDLVGFAWIDDDTLVAHHADRLDVIDANDGTVKGTATTDAEDMLP